RCPNCRQPLPAENDDLVLACPNCAAAVQIDDTGLSLAALRYAAPAGAGGPWPEWAPFWVFAGLIQIHGRDRQGWDAGSEGRAQAFWAGRSRFYAPAYAATVEVARQAGRALLEDEPEWHFVEPPAGVKLRPAVVSAADGRKLLDFIVVTIEASRKDWLKSLDYSLELVAPELWALPAGAWRWGP
ncbi:MAG: hypothetical protein ACRDHL_10185, partial [Candidatus Promineifilaceae bacterium]